MILYGNNLKRWENLIQGAELSAEESDAEINTVYMSGESDYSEQIGIIQREVSNGADALVIAACDSEEIGKYIDKSKINLPVIFVETGVDSKQDRTCICADDYEMGYELGKQVFIMWSSSMRMDINVDTIKSIEKAIGEELDRKLKLENKIDEELFSELEEILVMSDIGVATATEICDIMRVKIKEQGITDPSVIKYSTETIRFSVWSFFFLNLSHVYNGACRGAGNVKIPMYIAILGQVMCKYLFVFISYFMWLTISMCCTKIMSLFAQ